MRARRRSARVEYALPEDEESARWARRLITTFLTTPRTPTVAQNQVDEARLIVSELVTNAIRHAHSSCRMRLQLKRGRLTVEVHDDSPRLPRLIPLSTAGESGRGLAMVRLLASRFVVTVDHRGGKTVRAVLAAC
ncbi:ATP-binding protein [Streptomyces sp. CT34]|uniref:ATP-binding protein n=1 Tax=Streptomyces sp. CT34 TaxID=1553907 RepID=UPI00099B9BCB|nr:ATP-binding protein [Streptomyces sp. CT34]